jgi:hypothetical protein
VPGKSSKDVPRIPEHAGLLLGDYWWARLSPAYLGKAIQRLLLLNDGEVLFHGNYLKSIDSSFFKTYFGAHWIIRLPSGGGMGEKSATT